jgi:C1A family cysteine protease
MLLTVDSPAGPKQYNFRTWRRQNLDARDQAYSLRFQPAFRAAALPAKVDLRKFCSAVEDQGSLGSCTANAFAALIEANQNKIAVVNKKPLVEVSRLFEYYATRKLMGTVSVDSGATIRDSIKAAAKWGVINEPAWPYDVSKFKNNPPADVWNKAASSKISSYHAVADGDIYTMKSVLAGEDPYLITFGFDVYDYFLSRDMSTKGLLGLPGRTERLRGGHAVVLAGYDDTMRMPDGTVGAFLVRNSWGKGWGWQGSGYFWMSYAYVKDTRKCNDFWVVRSQPL